MMGNDELDKNDKELFLIVYFWVLTLPQKYLTIIRTYYDEAGD